MAYHEIEAGGTVEAVEVFYVPAHAGGDGPSVEQYPTIYPRAGWYWWACFPGCLPDGDPSGPFDSEADAIADAQGAM